MTVKRNGKVWIRAIVLGIATAIVVCSGLTMTLTRLVVKGRIGEGGVSNYVAAAVALSVLAGEQLTSLMSTEKTMLRICTVGLSWLFTMLTAGLLVDGIFSNALLNIGATGAATAVSCVLCIKKGRMPKRRKRKNR